MRLSHLALASLPLLSLVAGDVDASEATLQSSAGPIGISWESDRYSGYGPYGVPLNITNIDDELPQNFLADIYARIPDGQRISPDYLDVSSRSNLVVDEDFTGEVTVRVTYLNEGAGYRNTFGYFVYDAANPPQQFSDIADHRIIFPNASKPGGGRLLQGDTVALDIVLTGGEALGFFVIPNGYGWGSSANYAEIQSAGNWGQPFYSLPDLNPEPEGERQHNVVFYDQDSGMLVIGFEDVHRRAADNDFNDLIFTAQATPVSALVGIDENGAAEEGGFEPLVETPPAPVGSTTFYPSMNGHATLMFEDLWPRMGDYDFNDLVVQYNLAIDKNADGDIEAIEMRYRYQAVGAAFHNAFALHLPNVLRSDIASARLTLGDQSWSLAPEIEPNEVVFVLSEDVWLEVSDRCAMYRTLSDCVDPVSDEYTLSIEFAAPVSEGTMGPAPYDPFIFASAGHAHGGFEGREWEVHLKHFSGTSVFNAEWFGVSDDASNFVNSFVNENNMPWALNLNGEIAHATEGKDIQLAYPAFESWVLSAGSTDADWYAFERAVVENVIAEEE